MDYTSLEEVTKTIIEVIETEVGVGPEVFPRLLRNDNKGIGFYLFHVQENNYYKNYPTTGKDQPPVSFTPMALNLFYQLSVNWKDDSGDEDAYEEQRLMGLAMKSLHDKPVIELTSSGKKTNIKITLQTLTPSESVQYWAAAESPVRLSAYYEVSVVFLEPEKPKKRAGRVLSYGTFLFTEGPPRIIRSRSRITLTLPGETAVQEITLEPAQASPGNSIQFFGTGFTGDRTELLISSGNWGVPAVATAPWNVTLNSTDQLTITVQETAQLKMLGTSTGSSSRTFNFVITRGGTVGSDPIDITWNTNAGTNGLINLPSAYAVGTPIDIADGLRLSFSAGTLTINGVFAVTVQSSIVGPVVIPPGGIGTSTITSPGAQVTLLPGIYGAQINVVRIITLSNGTNREIQSLSNQFPFTVVPRIDNIGGVAPTGNLWNIGTDATITGFIFSDPLKPGADLDVQTYVAGNKLDRVAPATALEIYQFKITSPTTLEIKLPTGLDRVPFQVMVSGAESEPAWINVT